MRVIPTFKDIDKKEMIWVTTNPIFSQKYSWCRCFQNINSTFDSAPTITYSSVIQCQYRSLGFNYNLDCLECSDNMLSIKEQAGGQIRKITPPDTGIY